MRHLELSNNIQEKHRLNIKKSRSRKGKRVIRATREITIFKAQITQISQLFYDNYHSKNREIRATRA